MGAAAAGNQPMLDHPQGRRLRMTSSCTKKGFTLIEMMVAITVLGVIATLAFPDYQQWLIDTRIRNSTESIQNGLRYARAQAIARYTNVQFALTSASKADWTVCALSADTNNCAGANADILQSYTASGDVTIASTATVASPASYATTVSGGVPASVTFDALGRPLGYGAASNGMTSAARIDATAQEAGSRRLVISISSGGQVRACDPALPAATSPQGCF
jgi:type IV fimbrial biogenesis protein FimT